MWKVFVFGLGKKGLFVSFRVIQMVPGRGSGWSLLLCMQLGMISSFVRVYEEEGRILGGLD